MIKITFVSYGLCCAAPRRDGLDFVLVKGSTASDDGGSHSHDHDATASARHHYARLLVPTEWVSLKYTEPAHDVIGLRDGATHFVWHLEGREVSLSSAGTAGGAVNSVDKGLGKQAKPKKGEETDIRWIPSIAALARRKFDENNRTRNVFNATVVESVVHLPGGGRLASALYEHDDVWKFLFLNKVVDAHVVAERITYQLDYDLAGGQKLPLTLESTGTKTHKDDGKIEILLEKPKGTDELFIMVCNLPVHHSTPRIHFPHFYKLLEGQSTAGPVPGPGPGQALRPIQCGSARIVPGS